VEYLKITATGVKWAILYMLHNPEVQEKMSKEIQNVVGFGRLPSIHDKPEMPYCEAVINETLRIGNIVPLSVPHGTSEDVEFKGYTIPRNTVVIAKSCVPYVASFSGLSFFDCPFDIL
jgi:cytochrome P450